MALGKCRECGAEISDKAKNCPKCGVPKPIRRTSLFTWFVAAVVVAVLIVFNFVHDYVSQSVAASASSPENRARVKAEEEHKVRLMMTHLLMEDAKRTLRNPDSVVWESAFASADATVVCIEYRAQNGFGGMNREFVVGVKGRVTYNNSAKWNRHCTKSMFNTVEAKALISG